MLQDLLALSRSVAGAPRRALQAATPQAQDLSQCQTPSNLTVQLAKTYYHRTTTLQAWTRLGCFERSRSCIMCTAGKMLRQAEQVSRSTARVLAHTSVEDSRAWYMLCW